MFVTLFFGLLRYPEIEIVYSNCGHYPPLLFRADENALESLVVTGMVLGLVGDMSYQERSARLDIGDALVFYTDGVIDARNEKGELYGSDRLKISISTSSHLPAKDILDDLLKDISGFCSGQEQSDDITAIVIKAVGYSGKYIGASIPPQKGEHNPEEGSHSRGYGGHVLLP